MRRRSAQETVIVALVAALAAARARAHSELPTLPDPIPVEATPAPADTAQPVVAASVPARAYAMPEVTVNAKRPMSAASSTTVRDLDFLLRPHERPADVLAATPGLYVVQHAGGGKANQYFLRGFDADHGTDLAIFVDGVPANLVSHGHGQGYADLHWLIPEVVERIEVYKGPYFTQHGDFATAGAINVVTRGSFALNQVSGSGGSFGTYRTFFAAGPQGAGWRSIVAAEVYGTNGPFEHAEGTQRTNLFTKLTRELGGGSSLAVVLTSYTGGWHASGQIPLRAVRTGALDRFGSIDPTEGGSSQRQSLYATVRAAPDARSDLSLLAYVASYRLALFSNFTFFSADTVNGDMIEQNDQRTQFGLAATYRFRRALGNTPLDGTVGFQTRNDVVTNALHHDRERERISPIALHDVREGIFALFGQEDVAWTSWLRTVVGARLDVYAFDVNDRLEDEATLGSRTSGVRQATHFGPKASVIVSPEASTDVYLNYGSGFHSNDARGVARDGTPLADAEGYEVGARTRIADRFDVSAAGFLLNLEGEGVWVGDAGTTESRGPTQRRGLELEVRARLLPWLYADVDATRSRALYTENSGNANAVALAPTFVLSSGLSIRHPRGYEGRLGVFHIADRPATEDRFLEAAGFTRVDASIGYRYRALGFQLTIQNLFDVDWREAQFANVSRLRGEHAGASTPAGTRRVEDGGLFLGYEDLHFTPGAPFNVQGGLSVKF